MHAPWHTEHAQPKAVEHDDVVVVDGDRLECRLEPVPIDHQFTDLAQHAALEASIPHFAMDRERLVEMHLGMREVALHVFDLAHLLEDHTDTAAVTDLAVNGERRPVMRNGFVGMTLLVDEKAEVAERDGLLQHAACLAMDGERAVPTARTVVS